MQGLSNVHNSQVKRFTPSSLVIVFLLWLTSWPEIEKLVDNILDLSLFFVLLDIRNLEKTIHWNYASLKAKIFPHPNVPLFK